MEEQNSERLLKSLLEGNVENVSLWIQEISEHQSKLTDFNWMGLAETASFRAIQNLQEGNTSTARRWAEIGVIVYDFLASSKENAESFSLSSMMLRANLIRELGHLKNDPVLDVENIINWFRTSIFLSPTEAIGKAGNFRHLLLQEAPNQNFETLIKDSLELRKIKTRLGVMEILEKSSNMSLPSDIEEWLSVKNQLL